MADNSGDYFRFQIHHILAREIYFDTGISNFLNSIGLGLDSKGNKIALLTRPETLSKLQAATTAFKQMLLSSGWGLTNQNGSHPGYNDFLAERINAIIASPFTAAQKKYAAYDLFRFVTKVSQGVDYASVNLNSSKNDLTSLWDTVKLNVTAMTGAQTAALDGLISTHAALPNTDVGLTSNNQERFEKVDALHDAATAGGFLDGVKSGHTQGLIDQASPTKPNYTTSAGISLVYNITPGDAIPTVEAKAELAAAELHSIFGDTLTLDQLQVHTAALFSGIQTLSAKLGLSFSLLGADVKQEAANSFNLMRGSITTGVGGNAIGDAIEFLNAVYEPLKKGILTNDWKDFFYVVSVYGVGAVMSAAVVTVTVVGASFVHPILGAVVAAGWATVGFVDAVVNGGELASKILDDLKDLVVLAPDEVTELSEGIASILGVVKALLAEEPTTIDPHQKLYIADNIDAGLPDNLTGTDQNEEIWGRNGASIDGGGGQDELHHSGTGLVKGGAGDDIIVLKGSTGGNADGGTGDDVVVAIETNADVLKGGDGIDWVAAVGGTSANLYGGPGSDWIIGFSGNENLWGGDGSGGNDGAVDKFVISGGSFVRDASVDDIVMWGPHVLTGGVQQSWNESGWAFWSPISALTNNLGFASVVGGGFLSYLAGMADALAITTARYGVEESGSSTTGKQLVVQYLFGLAGTAFIDNYDFNISETKATANLPVFKIKQEIGVFSQYEFKIFLKAVSAQAFGITSGIDPMVLDLDGDGLELSREENGLYFDIDNDGFKEHTAWVGPDDGLLARDLNGNGTIDNQGELFGTATVAAHTALAALNSNGDTLISAADTGFSTLRIWRDLDSDGITDAGELQTLAQAGITSISLNTAAPSASNVMGNTVRAQSTVTLSNGQTRTASDVVLANNQFDSKWTGSSTVSPAAAAVGVTLMGHGDLKNLDIAMTGDAALLTLVTNFKAMAATSTWDQLKTAAATLLFKWAGVDTVATTPIITGFTQQQLAFLEKYSGDVLAVRVGGVPQATAAPESLKAYTDALSLLTIRLAAQGPMKAIFGNLTYDAADDAFNMPSAGTLATIYSNVLAQLSTVPATALTQWNANWGPMLKEFSDVLVRLDGNAVKVDFAIAHLVKAMTVTITPLSLQQLITGLGYQNVVIGTAGADTMTNPKAGELGVFVGGAGNDTMTGGNKQDVYVFGNGFGQDTIQETGGEGSQSGDRIRLATLNPNDVTFTRVGNDLVISVKNTTDTITVKNQFAAPSVVYNANQLVLDNGIEDIQFADGTIFEAGEIAQEIGKGTAASETLTGTGRVDFLRGLGGDDTMLGGDHGDMYVYSAGDGNDTINDIMTTPFLVASDSLAVLGIDREAFKYERVGPGFGDDLKISFNGTSGSLIIKGQFVYDEFGYKSEYSLNSRMEALFFNGGVAIGWQDIQQLVIQNYTTAGNDTVVGFGTADEFAASAGNDTLIGLDGGDTYHFGRNSGQDTINDSEQFGANVFTGAIGSSEDFAAPDTLVFDSGLTLSNLTFTRVNGANDLLISINGTTDTLLIKDQFRADDISSLFAGSLGQRWIGRVETFKFSDGTTLTWQQVVAQVTQGTTGNDTLYGTFGAETFEGKVGTDYLQGREGGDTYLFGVGDGSDTIEDRNTNVYSVEADTLQFKSGVTVAGTTFSITGTRGTDLLVRLNTTDQVLIKNQFDREDGLGTIFGEITADRIETFKWADGTTKTWSQIRQDILLASVTTGADTIVGTSFDETLNGGAGNDQLYGFDGDDTYVFGIGSGLDTVFDNTFNYLLTVGGDRVLMSAGILPGAVTVERAAGEGIRLNLNANDKLTIQDAYNYNEFSPKPNEVEYVEFSDGTKWFGTDLRAKALLSQVTTGNDTVRGFYSNDILTGGAGTDTLAGGDGSDTYRFNANDGTDTITEEVRSIYYASNDFVELGSVFTTANIQLSRPAGTFDLLITFTGRSETLRITDQFKPSGLTNNTAYARVEAIKFSNNTVWSNEFIQQRLIDQAKTIGNDTILGTYGDEVLDGGSGNDTLRGANGNDTYKFGSGLDVIEEISDVGARQIDTVLFDVPRPSVVFAKVGNDLRATIGANVLTIKNHFNSVNEVSRIEVFKFSTGLPMSYQDINALLGVAPSDGASIVGTSASETLVGTAGNDIIAGRGGDDIIELNATTGSQPGLGQDTVVYSSGDGNDLVRETGASPTDVDVLKFIDLNRSDVQLTRSGANLLVQVISTGQTITLENQFGANWFQGIEKLLFADGSEILNTGTNLALNAEAVIRGTSVSETLTGTISGDSFDSGAGADIVNDTGGGSDTYYWGKSDGNDTFTDTSTTHVESDVIKLKGLNKEDVIFSRVGTDLKITVVATNEVLTISNQFGTGAVANVLTNSNKTGIERFDFADGTSVNRSDILLLAPLTVATGASGDDSLKSLSSGSETLRGLAGNDLYIFNRGSGADTVSDDVSQSESLNTSYSDTLLFGTGIRKSDVQFEKSGDSLVVKILGTTDQMTITNQFLPDLGGLVYRIENFKFEDGTVLTASAVDQLAVGAQATSGNDTVYGFGGAETLDGGLGNDTLTGLAGSDTYLFGRDSGFDTINEQGVAALVTGSGGNLIKSNFDVVEFDADVKPADVTLSRSGNDLIVGIVNTPDGAPVATLTILGMFTTESGATQSIEEFQFSDGTTWTLTVIKGLLLDQANRSAADTILGFVTNDVIDGGAGNDTLAGGAGDDLYAFGRGSGSDTINDSTPTVDLDIVSFKQSVAATDILFSRVGDNLIMAIAGTSDQLTVNGQFGSGTLNQIEEVRFGDRTIWSQVDLRNRVLSALSTTGNDTIVAFANDDTLDGLAGNDTLTGSTGNDTYVFGRGYGIDTIVEGGSNQTDRVALRTGIATTDVQLVRNGTNVSIKINGTSDELVITNQLSLTALDFGTIEEIVFADGTTWTQQIIRDRLLLGTAGNDVITGYLSGDTINGLAGNDTIEGMEGADLLNGGADNDTVSYAASNAGVTVNLTVTSAQSSAGHANGDILSGFENIIGSASADTLTGDTLANILNGGAGNDILSGGSGTDTADYSTATSAVTVSLGISGTAQPTNGAGSDTLTDIENLRGSAFADTLTGSAGVSNVLTGLGGDDTYFIQDAGDTVVEAAGGGLDTVQSGITHTLALEVENLILTGTAAINGTGNGSNNKIIANSANNTLNGAAGTGDTLSYELLSAITTSGVTLSLAVTTAQATGGSGSDTISNFENLVGSTYVDTLTGSTVANVLTGLSGNDVLNGMGGNDTLHGGDLSDVLDGGTGADNLNGGSGNDTFKFTTGSSGQSATTLDTITDYTKGALFVGDKFDYSAILTIGGSAATATATQASINTSSGVATFASGSGTTLADALADISARFTAATNSNGEFAFFRIGAAGDTYMYVSDGTAGVTANDTLIRLNGVTSIGSINITSGDLTILT